MRKRRIAVLYTHPLFGRGVAQLLRADERLEVICLNVAIAGAEDELKRLKPYAIVAEGCGDSPVLNEAVRGLPAPLFIAVRLDDNFMDVYHSREVVTARPESLLEVIQSGLKERRPGGRALRPA